MAKIVPDIGEAIDRKFVILAVSKEHDHQHTHFDSVLFLTKDAALPATLAFYKEECARLGAADEQLLGTDLLLKRVQEWQRRHAALLKVADVDMSLSAGQAVVAPNVFETEAGAAEGGAG